MPETNGLPTTHGEREMREDTYRNFVYGLRAVIEDKFGTQVAFAKIMKIDPSTLSKNLNFISKMGSSKVERLAKGAGMTVMDIVDLGSTFDQTEQTADPLIRDFWEDDYLDGMTPVEVSEEVDDYIQKLYDQTASSMKIVTNRLRVLEKDRARLYEKCEETKAECEEKRGLFEAMEDAVKVNDRDKNVVFYNKAYARLAGGFVDENECGLFCNESHDCYVDKVFVTGEKIQLILPLGDKYFGISASPVFNRSGLVKKVVSVIRDITDDHLRALGRKQNRRESDK